MRRARYSLVLTLLAAGLAAQEAPAPAAPKPAQPQEPAKPEPAAPASAEAADAKAGGAKPKVLPTAGALPVAKGDKGSSDVVLNFSNARLFDIIQQVARLSGLNYTIDPALKDAPVRLFMNGRLEENSLPDVLALALKLNGVAMVRNGDFLEFVPVKGSSAEAAAPLFVGTQPTDSLGESYLATQVIPLKFLDAESFSGFAREFMSQQGHIAPDKARNLVVAVDYVQNLHRVLDFVALMDKQPFAQKQLALFRLRNVSPEGLVKELDPVLKAVNVPVGTGALQILPLQSLNAILVVTQSPEWIPDIKAWCDRFDEEPHGEEGELYVLPVKYAKADVLYPILAQVLRLQVSAGMPPRAGEGLPSPRVGASPAFGQPPYPSLQTSGASGLSALGAGAAPDQGPLAQASAPAAQPTTSASAGAGGPLSPHASITVDPENNSLLIFGNRHDYALVESAVRKLDQMPKQVLIEATILDITMTGEFEYGFSGFLQSHYDPSQINLSGASGGPFSRDARIDRPASDGGFTYTSIFASRFGLVNLVFSAKDSQKNANIISQPRLWALDNRPARLLVQDQIPIPVNTFIPGTGTGVGSSGYSVTNVQYLDTGLNLTVTPHINGSGAIRLELQQDISSSTETDTLGSGSSAITAPRISRRTLSTELIAQDGSTVVLGGLISEEKDRTRVGLPVLNRIPILRDIFSSNSKVHQKSELVLLLTPHIVAAPEDLDRVGKDLREQVQKLSAEEP